MSQTFAPVGIPQMKTGPRKEDVLVAGCGARARTCRAAAFPSVSYNSIPRIQFATALLELRCRRGYKRRGAVTCTHEDGRIS